MVKALASKRLFLDKLRHLICAWCFPSSVSRKSSVTFGWWEFPGYTEKNKNILCPVSFCRLALFLFSKYNCFKNDGRRGINPVLKLVLCQIYYLTLRRYSQWEAEIAVAYSTVSKGLYWRMIPDWLCGMFFPPQTGSTIALISHSHVLWHWIH